MSMITNQLQDQLEGLWTTDDVCKVLHRTAMTIHAWRSTRDLPAVEVPGAKRPAIRFVASDVLAWAKENDMPTYPAPVKRVRVSLPSSVKRVHADLLPPSIKRVRISLPA